MPDKPNQRIPRLDVDEINRFHLKLPNGEIKIIELSDIEIYAIENFTHLMGKHEIRLEIMIILSAFYELNVSQISQKVEQSTPTVSRHLRSMEKDGLLISRRLGSLEHGKIPEKVYRRNEKVIQVLVNSPAIWRVYYTDSESLAEFYKRSIDGFRGYLRQSISLLNKLYPLYDKIENQLGDMESAREIWDKFFDEDVTKNNLMLRLISFNKKYHTEFVKAYLEYQKKVVDILSRQYSDPEVKEYDFTAIIAYLPTKDLYEIYQKEVLEKKT